MRVFHTKDQLLAFLSAGKDQSGDLGLVPTMGALHAGHMSLVERALAENDQIVVSIFINPTQFNNPTDLEKYPKTLNEDLKLLEKFGTAVTVFAPSIEEMYTEEVVSEKYDFDGLNKIMEGAYREGHFEGVATIVERLLRLVKPERAYFGEKDFQQLQIIKRVVKQKKIGVSIIGCPIVREPSGLAMSSRNERLSKRLRIEAYMIPRILKAAKEQFGTKSVTEIVAWVEQQFESHPDLKLEYFTIADEDKLLPVKRKSKNRKYRAFIAVYAGEVRLIDNLALN